MSVDSSTGLAGVTPTVVAMGISDFDRADDLLLDESFGPLLVVVQYDDVTDLARVAREHFPGSLTATLHTAPGERLDELRELVDTMTQIAGRVIFNGWPTGVSVTPAMHHGGPWPASTSDTTSVGTTAIDRFQRAVAFQDAPDDALPPPLRDENPWAVPQRRSVAGLSASWGGLQGRY